MESKDILITGGWGFLGSNLAKSLIEKGHTVDIVDMTYNDRNVRDFYKGIITYHYDISNKAVWKTLPMEKYDVIYHFAANVSHIKAEKDPYIDVDANIKGTINLCEAVKDLRSKPRVIYSCSRSVYGKTKQMPVNESHPTDPVDAYGISKLAAEKYLQKYSYHNDIPAVSFRMANLVGPRQGLHTRAYQMISWIFRCVARDETVGFWGDGLQTRDFLYVGDAVRAYEIAGLDELPWEGHPDWKEAPPLFGVYNVPGGEYCTWLKAIQTCGTALGKNPKVQFEPYPNTTRIKLENRDSRLDGEKMFERFLYKPLTPLKVAFKNMSEYYADRWEDYLDEGVI